MKQQAAGYKVAVIGPSSLLGRELLALLSERKFPVASLQEIEVGEEEYDGDAAEAREFALGGPRADSLSDRDLVFIACDDRNGIPPPQGEAPIKSSGTNGRNRPTVISLTGGGAGTSDAALSIPFLDQATDEAGSCELFVAPHAATIMLSTLLLRLGSKYIVEKAAGTIFAPASEIGPRAIEELHKQTASLLSFQKLPKEIFGSQLAFNLLPRLTGTAQVGSERLEARVCTELHRYLRGRVGLPALRLVQSPAFYSMAVSLYVESDSPVPSESVDEILAGRPVRICTAIDVAPSQVTAAGLSEILVDKVRLDPARPEGFWIWAVADNLRLAAENAIRIAERACRAGR